MKIRQMGADLFYVDRQTDGRVYGQTGGMKLIVDFRNFSGMPKNCTYVLFPVTQSFDAELRMLEDQCNPKISLLVFVLVFALNVLAVDAIACRAVWSVRAAVSDRASEVPTV